MTMKELLSVASSSQGSGDMHVDAGAATEGVGDDVLPQGCALDSIRKLIPHVVERAYEKSACSCSASVGDPCQCPDPAARWPRVLSAGEDPARSFTEYLGKANRTVQAIDHWLLHGALLTGNRAVVATPHGAYMTTTQLYPLRAEGQTICPAFPCEDLRYPGKFLAGQQRTMVQSDIALSALGHAINRNTILGLLEPPRGPEVLTRMAAAGRDGIDFRRYTCFHTVTFPFGAFIFRKPYATEEKKSRVTRDGSETSIEEFYLPPDHLWLSRPDGTLREFVVVRADGAKATLMCIVVHEVSDGRLSPSGICFEARFKKPGCGRDYAAIVVADVCDPAGLVAPRGPNAKPSKDPREVLLHQMPRQDRGRPPPALDDDDLLAPVTYGGRRAGTSTTPQAPAVVLPGPQRASPRPHAGYDSLPHLSALLSGQRSNLTSSPWRGHPGMDQSAHAAYRQALLAGVPGPTYSAAYVDSGAATRHAAWGSGLGLVHPFLLGLPGAAGVAGAYDGPGDGAWGGLLSAWAGHADRSLRPRAGPPSGVPTDKASSPGSPKSSAATPEMDEERPRGGKSMRGSSASGAPAAAIRTGDHSRGEAGPVVCASEPGSRALPTSGKQLPTLGAGTGSGAAGQGNVSGERGQRTLLSGRPGVVGWGAWKERKGSAPDWAGPPRPMEGASGLDSTHIVAGAPGASARRHSHATRGAEGAWRSPGAPAETKRQGKRRAEDHPVASEPLSEPGSARTVMTAPPSRPLSAPWPGAFPHEPPANPAARADGGGLSDGGHGGLLGHAHVQGPSRAFGPYSPLSSAMTPGVSPKLSAVLSRHSMTGRPLWAGAPVPWEGSSTAGTGPAVGPVPIGPVGALGAGPASLGLSWPWYARTPQTHEGPYVMAGHPSLPVQAPAHGAMGRAAVGAPPPWPADGDQEALTAWARRVMASHPSLHRPGWG